MGGALTIGGLGLLDADLFGRLERAVGNPTEVLGPGLLFAVDVHVRLTMGADEVLVGVEELAAVLAKPARIVEVVEGPAGPERDAGEAGSPVGRGARGRNLPPFWSACVPASVLDDPR